MNEQVSVVAAVIASDISLLRAASINRFADQGIIWLDTCMEMTYLALKSQLESIDVPLEGKQVRCTWEAPNEYGRGVMTSTTAFALAKQVRRNPVEVAEELATELHRRVQELGVRVAATGPYINVSLGEGALADVLEAGTIALPQDQRKVMFEYIGANVAKNLHAGHMRNLNIGDALRRLLTVRYPNLVTDNHWGDWGIQFGIVIWAYKQNVDVRAYEQDPLAELQRLYVWGNAQKDTVENWEMLVRDEFKKLEAGEDENRRLWQEFLEVTRQEILTTLSLFKVPPTDLEQGESFYEPHMKELSEFCDRHGLWKSEGEARYIDFEEMAQSWEGISENRQAFVSKLGRCYLISSQGYTSYAFRDVAARFQWARDHEIDMAVTVTDDRQQHNFHQAFAIISYIASQPAFVDAFGREVAQRLALDRLVHVPYGRMQLESGDMSSRKGNVVALRDLYGQIETAVVEELKQRDLLDKAKDTSFLNTVTLAALKWHDLRSDPLTTVTLRPEEIVNFEGDTGVYQLYSYARLKSIRSKNASIVPNVYPDKLNDTERQLIEYIFTYQHVLLNAIEEFRPSILVNFIRTITQRINSWYGEYSLKDETDAQRQQAMCAFIVFVMELLEQHLKLLGIETVAEL